MPGDAPSGAGDLGETVDARGLACPLPVIHLARAAAGAPPGARLTVLSTDPAALVDVPAWARLRGHTLLATHGWPGGATAQTVRLGGAGSVS
ncbi:sulfurtransferase TusA family protein [Cellulomonas endophytica]|uniref:sulfurtransferase TusA family protein n=1 Tax=Cellulomonas endophytica TaxID=2494735 RepID=UPI0013E97A12|nr:sulfurtransferase TusA family protein [Cellulomonas endophytica]